MTRQTSRLFIIIMIVAGLPLSAQFTMQQPPRDSRLGPTIGTASLSGMLVTDETTPQPVRRARVSISSTDGQAVQTVYSDETGRFAADGLPAGRYLVVATRPSYVRASFGAKRYDRPGTPITLVDGQRLTDVVLKLVRGSVIAGTIVDDTAQPVPGVSVRIMQYRMQNGERVLTVVPLGSGMLNEVTDDRGAYRIFGLPAGDYVISATQPRNTGVGEIRQMTSGDFQAVQRALQQTATPGTAPAAAAAPAENPVTVGFAPVYYPGTTAAASATTVSIGAGEERGGVDFALQLVRTSRVEGVVVTPDGVSPQSVQLLMLASGSSLAGMPMSISFNRVSPGPDGKFSYAGVTPGQYTISARATGKPGTPGAQLWANADVAVDGQNLSGVNLTLQPGMTVSGRLTVEAVGADKPADYSRSRVSLSPVNPNGIMIGLPSADIDASGRFSFSGVTPGKYRLNGTLSSPEANWTLKSASAKGRDALDVPLEIGPNENLNDAVLTFTNLTQEVSGALQDATGRPAPDFTIVLFPAESGYWNAPRRIKTTRPGTDGKFVIKNVPAGNYRIAALVDIAPGDANDPTFLEQLVPASVAFTLRDGETHVQDLKIKSPAG